MKTYQALGRHILLELYQCDKKKLDDTTFLEQVFCAAAEAMGATIVCAQFHHFSPIGVSGVVIIQESHLTLHTWPEYGYAAVDIFTCGQIDMEAGIKYIEKALEATESQWQLFERGLQNRGDFKRPPIMS